MMAIQVLHNADGVWVSHFQEMLQRCMVPGKRCKVVGIRRRGRQKRRWLDNIRNDLSERELSGEDAQERSKWIRRIRHIDPT